MVHVLMVRSANTNLTTRKKTNLPDEEKLTLPEMDFENSFINWLKKQKLSNKL